MVPKKRISVCIATYNGEKFIYSQLQSILTQLLETDEVIISDNRSTDNTVKIIESFNDPRIKIIFYNKRNLVKNFENALLHACGEYIFLSDQDDIWHADKIQIMMNKLKSYDIVLSDCIAVDDELHVIWNSFYKINKSGQGLLKNIIKNSYIGCCMAFNRKILEVSLPFPENTPMHDWWIGLIGEKLGTVSFLNDKLILYRRHKSSASISGKKSTFSLTTKLRWRAALITNILKIK